MANIMEYLKFRGDVPFRISPFNEVDALALSICSYLDFTGLIEGRESLVRVAEKYRARCQANHVEEFTEKEQCFLALSQCKRYQKIKMENYQKDISSEEIKTYYALTFLLSCNRAVVAFPGTDVTMLSWEENFTFLYKMPAPGQEQSRAYLEEFLKKHPFVKTTVIGHSKGGNLAAYSSMTQDEKMQKRISDIYLFDAPGFVYDVKKNPGFMRVKDKMKSYIPEDCIVGELFMVPYPNKAIIKSENKRFAQHDMCHWMVGPSLIERGEALTKFSQITSGVFNNLVDLVEEDKRELVVTEVFDLIMEHGINELSDVPNMKLGQTVKMMMDIPKISPESKLVLKTLLKEIKNSQKN